MSTTRTCAAVLLVAVLCVPCYWALAGDKDKPKSDAAATDSQTNRADAPKDRDRPQSDAKADAKSDRDVVATDDKPTVMLGKTVKLEFKLVTPEETPTFPILCAIREFSISNDVSEPDFEHGMQLKGTLVPFDDRGRVLLTFEATTNHSDLNEGIDATHRASGSAILEFGKEKTLAVLGDSPLKVTATVDE